jgi:hypothetical protein
MRRTNLRSNCRLHPLDGSLAMATILAYLGACGSGSSVIRADAAAVDAGGHQITSASSNASAPDIDAAVAAQDGGFVVLPADDPALDVPCGDAGVGTARQLLDTLMTEYVATYTAAGDAGVSTALNILVSYAGGHVVCMPAPAGLGGAPESLSVEVALTFKTANGTFDEAFPAVIVGPASEPAWSASVPGSDIKGSYQFVLGSANNVTVHFDGLFNRPLQGHTEGDVHEQSGVSSALAGTWR